MKIIRACLMLTCFLILLNFTKLKLQSPDATWLYSSNQDTNKLYVINGIKNFVNTYYKDFIPYEIKKNQIIIEKNEYVRNIATMYDLLELQSHFYAGKKSIHGINLKVINNINKNADFYVNVYKKNPSSMRQASAFLALLLSMISPKNYQKDIRQITDFLYGEIHNLEPQFELGEVLMALSILNPKETILNDQIDKIIKNIEKNVPEIDHIFQYNWLSKFILAYNNDYSKKLWIILYKKVVDTLSLFTYEEETNYLAVAYECLASLMLYDSSIDVKKFIKPLAEKLIERYDPEYGLFKFKNGDIRLDITGHILNGLICLNSK